MLTNDSSSELIDIIFSKKVHDIEKNVHVSLLFTESASNFLHLTLPYIEDSCNEQSSVVVYERSVGLENFATYQLMPKFSNLSMDVALFHKNPMQNSSTSMLSEEDIEEEYDAEIEEILIPVCTHMQLFTINTLAHNNKMDSDSCGIYVSELDNEVLVTESGWINVCRICHGGESAGNLIAPCRCRGSVALAHLDCLERWLKESTTSNCELCNYHFQIIREPKYNFLLSILMFMRYPEQHSSVLLVDLLTFIVYTPTVVISTYMLTLLCDTIARTDFPTDSKKLPVNAMIFLAVVGMAMIDFTYTSWLLTVVHRNSIAWTDWYKRHCNLKLILPERKIKRCVIQQINKNNENT